MDCPHDIYNGDEDPLELLNILEDQIFYHLEETSRNLRRETMWKVISRLEEQGFLQTQSQIQAFMSHFATSLTTYIWEPDKILTITLELLRMIEKSKGKHFISPISLFP